MMRLTTDHGQLASEEYNSSLEFLQ